VSSVGAPAGSDRAAVGEAVHAQRRRDRAERDLDVGLARRLGAPVPGELAVADVVSVAVAEVDPVPVGTSDGAAPAADRVGLLEDDGPLPVTGEDRARDQPRECRADDDDVGFCRAGTHGRGTLAPRRVGVNGRRLTH